MKETKEVIEVKNMPIPSENAFSLNKVKTLKDGGLDVHYEVVETVGNEVYTNKYNIESAKDIHPDLRKLFSKLRPIMGRVFNITSFKTLVSTDEFKARPAQVTLAEDFAEQCLKNIEVRGISLSGKDDNVGVVLTGLYEVANGQKTAINTPRLKLENETWGFEEELECIIADIETEVYAFLFKGKKAELSLFGDEGEAEPAQAEAEPTEGTEEPEESF